MFGLAPGKIEIQLNKTNFKSGETIKGKLKLDLNKPVDARELRIVFRGEQERTEYFQGRRQTRTQVIHEFKLSLGGQQTYSSGEYEFEIQVPSIPAPKAPEGILGTVMNAASFLGGPSMRVKWFLDSSLDIPGGIDVSKKVQVSVE
ncbi:MAG TPA: hypothetical protein VJK05_04395 [archaeon]|nr:hypothetical protein [archaeon]